MLVVKGVYEDGRVTLPEEPGVSGRRDVTVLIPEEGDEAAADVMSFAGMLNDLPLEQLRAFDEALRAPIR